MPICVERVSTCGAWLVMVTVSVTWPSSSTKSTRKLCRAERAIFGRSVVRKPSDWTEAR